MKLPAPRGRGSSQIHSDNQSKYQSHVDQKTKYDQDNADRIHAEQEENQQAITDRIQKDLSKQSPEQDKKFWEFWKKACGELDFNLDDICVD